MVIIYFIELIVVGILAGFAGSLSGLGGGVVVIPLLTILFGVPIDYAAGASLVSTIATSSGAASAYVKERLSNIRIGMSLEVATTLGAIGGSIIAAYIYSKNLDQLIFIIFGVVLLFLLYPTFKGFREKHERRMHKDWSTKFFQLEGNYYDRSTNKRVYYSGYRWWFGEGVMGIAGIISGLLGIGSGTLKVIGMDWGMKLPMKVTTSTSNFMIGVTAATSSAIYWALGYVQPFIAAPIVIGILIGSYYGSKMLQTMAGKRIRLIFLMLLLVAGLEMILRGFGVA